VSALVVPATFAAAQTEPSTAGEVKFASEEAEHCHELLEQGRTIDDCQEAPNPMLPATNELFWGGLAFFLVLIALWKFGYPSIKKGLEDRTNRIRESIDEADRAKAEGQAVLADYQRQLADAKTEANRIIDEARQAADSVRADLIARAEAEVAELRQRSREDVEAAKTRAIADLQAQLGDLTIEIAEKIVGRSIDPETNRALIDQYISELAARN
jgi:F-type H+-transporting ATPase subunit b